MPLKQHEIVAMAELGCFPSFKEPFGLVFVECMACKTPVIGANSGGPKDFVVPEVGELVAEPPETKDGGAQQGHPGICLYIQAPQICHF